MNGQELHAFAGRLYPICRSITGQGLRETLAAIRELIPLQVREVPSGSRIYDWEVPLEWNIEGASILSPDGGRVVDFGDHNLHVVSYSEPVTETMPLETLDERLHSMPEHPTWIPYRTSYYRRSWGFCLPHETRQSLVPGQYRVEINSSLAPGSLSYGECFLRGRSPDEVLFFTHACHPSLANDNASGMAIATALARWIASEPRRFSYRLVFAPGTIGCLCWLHQNESRLARVRAGLVLALLGDSGALTYKSSRAGSTISDAVAGYVISQMEPDGAVIPFSPYGYDERQLCSPGFNLPIGRLTRSVNGGYPEYHSSADDMQLIRPDRLAASLDACRLFVTLLEQDARYVNLSPKGEPQLGKRGLYGSVGGRSPAEMDEAMLWLLNQSDGSKSLLDVAQRSGLSFGIIRQAALALERAGLLEQQKIGRGAPSSVVGGSASRRKGGRR